MWEVLLLVASLVDAGGSGGECDDTRCMDPPGETAILVVVEVGGVIVAPLFADDIVATRAALAEEDVSIDVEFVTALKLPL